MPKLRQGQRQARATSQRGAQHVGFLARLVDFRPQPFPSPAPPAHLSAKVYILLQPSAPVVSGSCRRSGKDRGGFDWGTVISQSLLATRLPNILLILCLTQ